MRNVKGDKRRRWRRKRKDLDKEKQVRRKT